MPPVPLDAFASELRSLPASDRAEFVAGLWSARGWETTVDGDLVVAERDSERRHVRVVDPGRFGTPDPDGTDTLVVARDREAVRDAAAEAGVEYVPPAELRDLLLYGIDREAAEALYGEWFERPLERTPATESDGAATGAVSSAIPSTIGSRRAILAVVLIALVGVAALGPTLPTGEAPAQSPITVSDVTPGEEDGGAIGASSPTRTEPPGLVPGVTRAGVVDPSALTAAHVAGVRNRSRVVAWELTSPVDATTGANTFRNSTARIENASHYERRGVLSRPEGNETVRLVDDSYAGGGDVFRRISGPNVTRYARYDGSESPATSIDAGVEGYLYRYFVSADDTIVRCAIEYDTDCPTYRIEVDGEPPDALSGEVEGYEALAIVSDRGVVTTIRASYTLPDRNDDGEREQVRFSLDYQFEDVSVSPPAWLPEARNETTETNGTVTGTASG